jgi:phage recombination protein Bet
MNTAVVTLDQPPMMLDVMASRAGLRPQEFADTVRKTCGLATATNEEFAAFLLVAKQYDLNPILREIYAFPRKGGGIVPILSLDGWVSLINRHPQSDGFEFEDHHDTNNRLVAITCRMFRKDRSHPVEVTEYLSECIRPTEPWKMQHRMLRHKAMIQAARYCFGFAGIFDEDEGIRIAEAPAREIVPAKKLVVPPPPEDAIPEFEDAVVEDAAADSSPPTPPGGDAHGGSSQSPHVDAAAASSPKTNFSRSEAIGKMMVLAGDADVSAEEKLENLDQLQPHYAELLGEDFTKALLSTTAKLIRGELKPAAAKKYLEAL